jgi:hypothetical protein
MPDSFNRTPRQFARRSGQWLHPITPPSDWFFLPPKALPRPTFWGQNAQVIANKPLPTRKISKTILPHIASDAIWGDVNYSHDNGNN